MELLNPYFFPVFFLFLWVVIMNFISRLGGWARLAEVYRFDGNFNGRIWRFQSLKMRMGAGYNNCVNIGANTQGLYLSVFFLCRPGHPPLFVRWSDISVAEKKRWGLSRLELRFRKAEDIPIGISAKFEQKLAEASGEQWPGKNPLIYTAD